MITVSPATDPTSPCTDGVAKPVENAFVGLIGGKIGPINPSMSGDTATTVRPCPFVAANTEPAAPQIAIATSAPVGVAGITGPAVAAAVITVPISSSVSIA